MSSCLLRDETLKEPQSAIVKSVLVRPRHEENMRNQDVASATAVVPMKADKSLAVLEPQVPISVEATSVAARSAVQNS